MRVAFCTEYLLPQINGIAVRCDEYIRYLSQEDLKVDVYGPDDHRHVTSKIHTITNYWNKGNRLTIFPNIKLIWNILSRKYDTVHVVLPLFLWFPFIALAAKISGTKLVLSNHVNLTYYNKSYYKNRFINLFLLSITYLYYKFQNLAADIIMAPSNFEETKKYLNPKKFKIIKSGIDTNKFFPLEKKVATKNIVYVGRIAPEKNLDSLFQLFLKLEGYTLTIIGDGPELKRFQETYKDNKNIHFLGFIEHDKLAPYYQAADFHLVTSLSETFGFTLLESMSCGTPVLYPECGVFKSLYRDEFPDLMYDIKNENSFLKAVNSLNENLETLSQKSVEYAKNHSWKAATQDLMKSYLR
ncbi:MAG: glycosyltransferase family 4 protein [Leptospiraceae bacterium]|nr:glycosyltransferase family 4 protein [Leptospiraceae bacterium]